MSTQDCRMQPLRYSRNLRRRKTGLNVDLNTVPPCENRGQVGTSTLSRRQEENLAQPVAIDLEAVDDDVVISSPSAFAAAKNKSQRNPRRTVVVDVDSASTEERSSPMIHYSRCKRRRVSVNQVYINLEVSNNSMQPQPRPPPPPPAKEVTFNCPICMGPLVEEMTTKCGHIFCKACIKAAIAAQTKCPTCRRRVTAKDLMRIYLPSCSNK